MTDSGMVQYLLDQLHDPDVTARAMFGGHGIYRNGHMCALVYGRGRLHEGVGQRGENVQTSVVPSSTNQTIRSFREITADELEIRMSSHHFSKRPSERHGSMVFGKGAKLKNRVPGPLGLVQRSWGYRLAGYFQTA